MAKVTHVKKAQQRYATKPVLDEQGNQKQTPVMRGGKQKTTKSGKPVFLKLTERDYSKPLPMPRCGAPTCKFEDREIKVGMAYKWIEPHGRGTLTRHEECPSWYVWEYSSSLSARVAQIQHLGPDASEWESKEDAEAWANEKAEEIRELANEKEEAADNMEEGFGHETEQSAEIRGTAEQLNEWADSLEDAELPDFPEPQEEDCIECGGSGKATEDVAEGELDGPDCDTCDGRGLVTPEEPTGEQLDEWREEVQEALQSVLDESPM